MKHYRVDACAVQETKIKDAEDFKLPGRGTLHVISQQEGDGGSRGMYICIGPRLLPFLKYISRVNHRIAYAVFEIPKMQRPLVLVCAYGPTLPSCHQNSELRDLFYDSLEQALDRFPRRAFVFVCGDWNSKVGRCEACSTFQCLGRWSRGTLNDNGEALLQFAESKGLLLANTCFQLQPIHLTTWVGAYKPKNVPTDSPSIPVYNQIDYILVAHRHRRLLQACKGYSGTMTSSDHRLLIATIAFPTKLQYRRPPKPEPKLAVNHLASNSKIQTQYQLTLGEKLRSISNMDWAATSAAIQETAHETIGLEVKPKNHRQFVTDDPEISQLSKKQKELRIQMMTALPRDRARLRRERYHILRRLPMLVKKRLESVLQAKAEAVEKLHNDGAKMFAAVKEMKLQKVAHGIMVNNIAGERIVDPNEQVS